MVETSIIASSGVADNGVVGLKALDKNITVLVATIGATDNLSDQFVGTLFGSVVRETEASIGLNNAKRTETRKIKTFSDHLRANENVIIAGMNGCINFVRLLVGFGVRIETGEASIGEEFAQLGLDEFSAKTFMMNSGIATVGASSGDRIMAAASVAAHGVLIGVKNKWKKTISAESLPATMVTNGERCSTAAIMENQTLLMVVERSLNASNKRVAENVATGKIRAILKVDDGNVGGFGGFNGKLVKFNDGVVLLADIIIGDKRCSGAE